MVNKTLFIFPFIFSFIYAQFGTVDINLDTRLLRSEEKQEVLNLNNDIRRFFINSAWDESYSDLEIPLIIQFVFEGVTVKGNERIFNCQALFSNSRDIRYFDKSVQFIYNSGSNLYFDPVLFEPLSGFLAYYAYLILGGEIDTYEFNGGNAAFESARDIALRGSTSDYVKGWDNRISLVDDINRNIGLRKSRLAWYIAMDLFKDGDIEGTIEEINNMLDGIEQSFQDLGRDHHTQYFLKVHAKKISEILIILGRKELIMDMKELDLDRRDFYQDALDSISR
tara:strand:- start:149 stop:991 length:843 start_codon:yes stop_codon:yes gene_type:complete